MVIQPSVPIAFMTQLTEGSPPWNRGCNMQQQQLHFSSLITIRTVTASAELACYILLFTFSFLYG